MARYLVDHKKGRQVKNPFGERASKKTEEPPLSAEEEAALVEAKAEKTRQRAEEEEFLWPEK